MARVTFHVAVDAIPDSPQEQIDSGAAATGQAFVGALMALAAQHYPEKADAGQVEVTVDSGLGPFTVHPSS